MLPKSASSPVLFNVHKSAPARARKSASRDDIPGLPGCLRSVHNGPLRSASWLRSTSRLSLHSDLDAEDYEALMGGGSLKSLDDPGDLRKETPSPNTRLDLDALKALLDDLEPPLKVARERAVWNGRDGRLQPVPQGSAEYLLMQHHGLHTAQATQVADTLRRGGFQPSGDGVSTIGGIADAMARLGARERRRALPAEVCRATEAALANSMARHRDSVDPWHQVALDLPRNPYTLNGTAETSLQAFREATQSLHPLQQGLAWELHQGLLAALEACIFFGNVLHPGGALLRSNDGSNHGGPRADTRFHLTIVQHGPDDARVMLEVQHDRPLSSALPATAGLDALPERRTLVEGSAYHVTLRAECLPSGELRVWGHHSVLLDYLAPAPTAAAPAARPATDGGIDPRVLGQLTADVMDLHALLMDDDLLAVGLHLAANDPEHGAPRIAGMLALARALESQAGADEVMPPELMRFAFAELRRCAETARQQKQHDRLALLRRAVIGSHEDNTGPALGLPGHGHWQHARQEFCSLLAVLLYRSAEESAVPALDTPATFGERRERDGQLKRLIEAAKAEGWEPLAALLPTERLYLWGTTQVQRPSPCAYHHGSAARYLEVALHCLNALSRRAAPQVTGSNKPL